MQAALTEETKTPKPFVDDDEWCAQEKIDGERMIVVKRDGELTCFRRGGSIVETPSLLACQLYFSCDMTLDGEFLPATGEFVAFDLLSLEGVDLRKEPQIDRFHKLETVSCSIKIRLVRSAASTWYKEELIHLVKSKKGEGVVFKRKSDPYPSDRSYGIKYKFYKSESFVVTARNISACTIELQRDGINRGSVSYLFSDKEWPKEGDIVEVRFSAIFKSGKLRSAKYLSIRKDLSESDLIAL